MMHFIAVFMSGSPVPVFITFWWPNFCAPGFDVRFVQNLERFRTVKIYGDQWEKSFVVLLQIWEKVLPGHKKPI